MNPAIRLLLDNPVLYLFVISATGYFLGKVKLFGCQLGVVSVLFTGLAFGSLHPDLKLPEIVYVLGLVLFVYTIGLSSGHSFVVSFRRAGLRDNAFAAGILIFGFALTVLASRWAGLKPTLSVGMYAGSFTNTPAIAAVLDIIKHYAPKEALDRVIAEPMIGYSVAYPLGVGGVILAILLTRRLWKIDYAAEAAGIHGLPGVGDTLSRRTVRVTRPEAARETVQEAIARHQWHVAFSRIKRGDHFRVATSGERLQVGDRVCVVGSEEELNRVTGVLGEPCAEPIERDASELEMRRIFVSNPAVAGRTIKALDIGARFGAVATRLRRGDTEWEAGEDTVLELGDRVRVVAPLDRMVDVSAFLGDSYRAVSEVDILTFSLGLAAGLLLGSIAVPLPGGLGIRLGYAGGPLIVGLILGALGRTGGMVWNIPYSANMTLRQIGLILFLAGIGTRAGYGFGSTFLNGGGLAIFAIGGVITFVTAFTALAIGHLWLKIPFSILIGMLASIYTQPAVLGFALDQTKNDLPNFGYSSVYAVSMILKILLAQLLIAPFLSTL